MHIEYVEEYIDGLVQGRRNSSALAMEFPVFFALTHQSSLLYLMMILLPVIVSINPGFLWKKNKKIKIKREGWLSPSQSWLKIQYSWLDSLHAKFFLLIILSDLGS